MSRETACTHCRTFTRHDLLVDATGLLPFGGLLCPDCDDRLTAEEHDDPLCTCSACEKYGRPAPVLRVLAGFHPERRELLGSLLSADELAADNDQTSDQQANAAE